MAKMLKTTQQTVGRWEKGKAEPSISSLRDIAMIFGTSVDDLLGVNPLSGKPTSTLPSMPYDEESMHEGFWGHFGVLLSDSASTQWYPITDNEAQRVRYCLQSDRDWVVVSTLNNRILVINIANILRLSLHDDYADAPEADWNLSEEDCSGLPLEFYRGLDAYSYEDNWEENTSETFREIITGFINEHSLDENGIAYKLHYTTIHLTSGDFISYWANANDLEELSTNADSDDVSKVVQLNSEDGTFESFYSASNIKMVEMPLIDVIDKSKAIMEEFLS
jgi:transcriptional regulator with XRE-family HTH domain